MGATMPGRIHRVHSPSSRRCFVHLGCAPRLTSFPTTGSILHIPRALTHSLALSNAQKLYHLTFLRIHYPHVIFAFTVSLATVISNVIDPLYPRRLIILESTCIIHATSSICLCLAKEHHPNSDDIPSFIHTLKSPIGHCLRWSCNPSRYWASHTLTGIANTFAFLSLCHVNWSSRSVNYHPAKA